MSMAAKTTESSVSLPLAKKESPMKELVIKIKNKHYNLFLRFLKTLDYVTIVPDLPAPVNPHSAGERYDFSDLAGKLEWKGDALDQQRMIRDEW